MHVMRANGLHKKIPSTYFLQRRNAMSCLCVQESKASSFLTRSPEGNHTEQYPRLLNKRLNFSRTPRNKVLCTQSHILFLTSLSAEPEFSGTILFQDFISHTSSGVQLERKRCKSSALSKIRTRSVHSELTHTHARSLRPNHTSLEGLRRTSPTPPPLLKP